MVQWPNGAAGWFEMSNHSKFNDSAVFYSYACLFLALVPVGPRVRILTLALGVTAVKSRAWGDRQEALVQRLNSC